MDRERRILEAGRNLRQERGEATKEGGRSEIEGLLAAQICCQCMVYNTQKLTTGDSVLEY